MMEFYHQVRYDSLRRLELTPLFMEEHFEDRDDRLYHRHVMFDARTKMLNKWSITDGTIRRTVTVRVVICIAFCKIFYSLNTGPVRGRDRKG